MKTMWQVEVRATWVTTLARRIGCGVALTTVLSSVAIASGTCDPTISSCVPGSGGGSSCSPMSASLGLCTPGSGGGGGGGGGGGVCTAPPGGSPTCSGSGAATQGGGSTPSSGAGNPINLLNGNKYQEETDLAPLPGVLGLELKRYYNSQSTHPGLLGANWRMSYETVLYDLGSEIQIVQADGRRLMFQRGIGQSATLCSSPQPQDGQVRIEPAKDGKGQPTYYWRWADGRTLMFSSGSGGGYPLQSITAATGERVTLNYSPTGEITSIRDPQGRQLVFIYASAAEKRSRALKAIDTPLGRLTYNQDALGRLTEVGQAKDATSAPFLSRLYHYEDRYSAGHPQALTGISVRGPDPQTHQITEQRLSTYVYNAAGLAILSTKGRPREMKDGKQVADTGIEQVEVAYLDKPLPQDVKVDRKTGEATPTRLGKVVLTNSLGQTTQVTSALIAGHFRLMEMRGPGCSTCGPGNMRYAYDAQGLLIRSTKLDDNGMPVRSEVTELDKYGRTARVGVQDYAGSKAQPTHWTQRFEYPDVRYADGSVAVAPQPSLIAQPSVITGKEHTTAMRYNTVGQVVQVTEAGFSPIDASGNATSVGTSITRSTTYLYRTIEGKSVLVEIDGPLPNGPKGSSEDSDVSRLQYDEHADRVVGTVRPLGGVARLLYDRAGRIVERAGEDGLSERLGYDELGRISRLERAGKRLDLSYGATGDVTEVRDSLGQHLSLRYDTGGHLIELRDPQGNRIDWTYTSEGGLQELQLLNPDGSVSQRRSVGPGSLASTLAAQLDLALPGELTEDDSDGRKTTYLSDDFGRRVVQVSPTTGRTTLRYDAADRLVAKTASDGDQTIVDRDPLGRATRVRTTGEDAHIEWGRYNRPVRMTYRSGEERYDYDGNGRLTLHTRLVDGKSFSTRYEYDAVGRAAREIRPDGQTLAYRYNSAQDAKPGVLASIVREGAIDTPIVDNLNLASERFDERGFAYGNGLRHSRLLDDRGRALQVGSKAAGASQLRWNGLGEPSVSYRASAVGQHLDPEVARSVLMRVSFALPQLGASPRKADLFTVLDPPGKLQRFDGRGRLVEDDQRLFVWDGMDRLIEVQAKSDAGPRPIARYRYNLVGERIAKTVFHRGEPGTTTYFFYDSDELTAEADSSGKILRDYVYIDHRPVAMLDGRAVLAIHTDHRMAPMTVTDKDRNVVWQASIGDNGDAAVASGSLIDMPLRGSNQYFDRETGLHYNTQRYLDAHAGRYISPDPMGLAAGPDLYQFALHRPHQFVDALGLAPAAADVKLVGMPPGVKVADMTLSQKLNVIFQSSMPLVPGEVRSALQSFVDNLPTVVGVFAAWTVLQAVPFVGEAVDVLIAGAAWYEFGSSAVDLVKGLLQLIGTLNSATCEGDLKRGTVQLVGTTESLIQTTLAGLGAGATSAHAAERVGTLFDKVVAARKVEGAAADYAIAKKTLKAPDVNATAVVGAAVDELESMDATIGAAEQAAGQTAGRPTWQQSEVDVGKTLGAGWTEQDSFLNGVEEKRGTKGSVRPDWCNKSIKTCVEVKNYDIATNSANLVKVISEQAIVRAKNLPAGFKQEIVIDVRGQSVSSAQRQAILKAIVQKSNGIIKVSDISFLP